MRGRGGTWIPAHPARGFSSRRISLGGHPTGIPAHPSPPPRGRDSTWGRAARLAGGGLAPAFRMQNGQRRTQSFPRKMMQNARLGPAWPIAVTCSPPQRGLIPSDDDFEVRGPCGAGGHLDPSQLHLGHFHPCSGAATPTQPVWGLTNPRQLGGGGVVKVNLVKCLWPLFLHAGPSPSSALAKRGHP